MLLNDHEAIEATGETVGHPNLQKHRIDKQYRNSAFWDRVAHRYARSPIADEASYRHKLSITKSYFRPEMKVLEVGCGTGSTALHHAAYVKHIHAIDVSSKMVEIAQEKAENAEVSNVTFERASIESFLSSGERFEVVLALSVLHLLEDREVAFAKIYRWLQPGGVIVSSTACLGDWLQIFKLVGPIGRAMGFLPTVKVFTTHQLIGSLQSTGFIVEEVWQPGPRKAVFLIARKPL
ncbi:MAG: class I SAM-dependent methyltransferase [Hyphomicrobiaceae bacterium]